MSLIRACGLAEVPEGTAIPVELDGADIAIVRSEGQVYAIADQCSHAAIPLSEGDVIAGEIECYLHGSTFDLRTGRPRGLPATEPVPVFRCVVEAGNVLVDPTPLTASEIRDAVASGTRDHVAPDHKES